MSRERLLAIDVGTQSARAIVFDRDGGLCAKAQVVFAPTYHSPEPGWAEHAADFYWDAVAEACAQLWQQGLNPAEISGLALTTKRATVICTDGEGRPLRPAILWLDQRRATKVPSLGALAFARHLPVLGPLLQQLQQEAESNWLAQHEPSIWARTEKFLFLSGYLNWKLTGRCVDSTGSQVGYVPFDYRRLDWAGPRDIKWRALGLRRSQLPELVPPGSVLGPLQPSAAEKLGLPAQLPVVAAAADKACEVLGSGAIEPDTGSLSFGTSASINTTQSRYMEVQAPMPSYPAALPGAYNTEVMISRGFWMVSWFKREFAQREVSLAAERGVTVESLFDDLVRSVPPGAMGLTLQPYWSPGVRNPGPEAKGAIIGFGDVHTRAHMYRAILEGLAYSLRAGRDQIEKCIGQPIQRLVVAGGGSQSDAAMQITADVFGLEAQRPAVYETSALGAAMALSVGLGVHADFPTAVKAMTRIGRRFVPDPQAVARYDALYREVYAPLYGRLRPIYQKIRRITGYPS